MTIYKDVSKSHVLVALLLHFKCLGFYIKKYFFLMDSNEISSLY